MGTKLQLLETEVLLHQLLASLAFHLTAPHELAVARFVDDFAGCSPTSSAANVLTIVATFTILDVNCAVVWGGVQVDELVSHLLRGSLQSSDVSL